MPVETSAGKETLMKVLVYSVRPYDRVPLVSANMGKHDLHFTEARLDEHTAMLAKSYPAVCCFVDDDLNAGVLQELKQNGTGLVALRSTGFNNVDLPTAAKLNITVMRVRLYSPYAVAEFAVGMMLALNRKIHRAYERVREGNFLLDGLLGFDMYGKTVGIIGTGKIGSVLARILNGFGCNLLGYDVKENPECLSSGMRYVDLEELLKQSDIVSLHTPLTPETCHMINARTLSLMKESAVLINTSRGALVDSYALVDALKKRRLGAAGLDVYEEESHIYFRDLSDEVITDDVIMRLITFPNVIITGHQAFFTKEALDTIAETTISNISDFEAGRSNENILEAKKLVKTASKKK
jgi:D-lactate dehydrogenase